MVEKAIRLQGANDGLLSLMKDDPSIKITQVTTVVIVIITTIILMIIVIVIATVITLCFYEANGEEKRSHCLLCVCIQVR